MVLSCFNMLKLSAFPINEVYCDKPFVPVLQYLLLWDLPVPLSVLLYLEFQVQAKYRFWVLYEYGLFFSFPALLLKITSYILF